MFQICNTFAIEHEIIVNQKKKTVCIKFGEKLMEGGQTILNGLYIQWTDKVKFQLKYIVNSNTYDIDFKMKRSLFNGYVNKLKAHFGNLQNSILMNLFKSYCCSFMDHICGNIVQMHLINVVKRGILI